MFLLFLSVSVAVATENVTQPNATKSRHLDSSTQDDCKIATSGSSMCGLAYQSVMQNKYVAEACASAYFYEIKDCQNINCVFNKMPKDGCACKTTFDSLSYCLDYNNPTQMCRTMLRLWLDACIYPSNV